MQLSPEILQLWENRPGSVDQLAAYYVGLLDGIDEEYQGVAFLHLRRAIEMFDPASNHLGYDGFKSYALFRIRMSIQDERTKERDSAAFLAPVSHAKRERRQWREANRVYVETGEMPDRDFSVISTSKVFSFETPTTSSEGRETTLADGLGREDRSGDANDLWAALTADERELVEDLVAGTPFVEIAKRKFDLDDYRGLARVKGLVEQLYDKIIDLYRDDEQFKSLFEQIDWEKKTGQLRYRGILISEREYERGRRDADRPRRVKRKIVQQIEGYPSRARMIDAIASMSWPEMEKKFGFSHKKLLSICKEYQLEYYLAKRPKRIIGTWKRREASRRARELGRDNARLRANRVARGWSPEIPPDPKAEDMLPHILSKSWGEMADIFQLSESYLRELAIKYDLYRLRPKKLRSKETNRQTAAKLRKKHAELYGATVPTKEDLEADLPRMSWNELIDKYGFSISTLKSIAHDYGIAHLKGGNKVANHRKLDAKYPWPSAEDFRKMIVSMSMAEMEKKLHRTQPMIRRKAAEMGLGKVMTLNHKPSKQSINAQIKSGKTWAELSDYYSMNENTLRNYMKEIGIDPNGVTKDASYERKKAGAIKSGILRRQMREAEAGPLPHPEVLRADILNQELSASDLEKKHNRCRATLRRYALEVGLGDIWPTPEQWRIRGLEKAKKTIRARVEATDPSLSAVRYRLMLMSYSDAAKDLGISQSRMMRLIEKYKLKSLVGGRNKYRKRVPSKDDLLQSLHMRWDEMEKKFGLPAKALSMLVTHLGLTEERKMAISGVPASTISLLKELLPQELTWNQIAERLGMTPGKAMYLAKKQGFAHLKKQNVRTEEAIRQVRIQRRAKRDSKFSDIVQLKQDLISMTWDDLSRKYRCARSCLVEKAKELGVLDLRPQKVVTEDSRLHAKEAMRRTWAEKSGWPSKESVEQAMRDHPGISRNALADLLGVNRNIMKSVLPAYGLEEAYRTSRQRSEATLDELKSDIDAGLTLRQIAEKRSLGSPQRVARMLKEYGLKTKFAEAGWGQKTFKRNTSRPPKRRRSGMDAQARTMRSPESTSTSLNEWTRRLARMGSLVFCAPSRTTTTRLAYRLQAMSGLASIVLSVTNSLRRALPAAQSDPTSMLRTPAGLVGMRIVDTLRLAREARTTPISREPSSLG